MLQGDSGGPLIYNNNTESSTVIGIASTVMKPDWRKIFIEDGEYVSYEVTYLS